MVGTQKRLIIYCTWSKDAFIPFLISEVTVGRKDPAETICWWEFRWRMNPSASKKIVPHSFSTPSLQEVQATATNVYETQNEGRPAWPMAFSRIRKFTALKERWCKCLILPHV